MFLLLSLVNALNPARFIFLKKNIDGGELFQKFYFQQSSIQQQYLVLQVVQSEKMQTTLFDRFGIIVKPKNYYNHNASTPFEKLIEAFIISISQRNLKKVATKKE